MEVAGLALGVAAAIIPAYQGIDKLLSTLSDAKRFSSQFHGLCDFDIDGVKAMLWDEAHPNWSDSKFQRKLSDYLGDGFEPSLGTFRVITLTLNELETEIKEFIPTFREYFYSRDASTVRNDYTEAAQLLPLPKSHIKKAVAKTEALAKGFAWSIQKQKLQKLQETLRDQVNDREQRATLKEFRAPTQTIEVVDNCNLDPLSAIRDARTASNRLYRAVRAVRVVTNCHCHSIDLQLSTGPGATSDDSADEVRLYRLLVAPLSNTTAPSTYLVVRPERAKSVVTTIRPTTTARASDNRNLPRGCMKRASQAAEESPIAQTATAKRKVRVRFDLRPELELKKVRPAPDDHLQSSDVAKEPELSQQQIMTGIVTPLCPAVGLLRVGSVSVSTMTYLGLLPDVDTYRHVLYQAENPPFAARMFLGEIIRLVSSNLAKKSLSWPVGRRYGLGYMLAFSMLCSSSSWLKEN
ncbi:hypothetical protein BDD12DRAFT_879504 [Trichophaea hybrida]|nr:hypothetical protein BDD12DRAFT_879504 [Trichophaea hybrida]